MAGGPAPVRDWVVGGGLVLSGRGEVLLVQNRRRNGHHDWSPPGGVIDDGESVIDGLTREVQEETGLRVTEWRGPVYEVRCRAPGLGWTARVEVHLAVAYDGVLHVDDPDGIVVDARFVAVADCARHLVTTHPWVREPLAAWLEERWDPLEARPFAFVVEGRNPASLVVTRDTA